MTIYITANPADQINLVCIGHIYDPFQVFIPAAYEGHTVHSMVSTPF